MAFVVRYRGLEVVCESVDDLNRLADHSLIPLRGGAFQAQRGTPYEPTEDDLEKLREAMRQQNATQNVRTVGGDDSTGGSQ